MIFKLGKPKPPNGWSCSALLNVWVHNSEFAKVFYCQIDMTELISKAWFRRRISAVAN